MLVWRDMRENPREGSSMSVLPGHLQIVDEDGVSSYAWVRRAHRVPKITFICSNFSGVSSKTPSHGQPFLQFGQCFVPVGNLVLWRYWQSEGSDKRWETGKNENQGESGPACSPKTREATVVLEGNQIRNEAEPENICSPWLPGPSQQTSGLHTRISDPNLRKNQQDRLFPSAFSVPIFPAASIG